MKSSTVVLLSAAGMFLAAGSLAAHHSGNYDNDHPITFSGTVTVYQMVSPHGKIVVETKDPRGNIVTWTVVTAPPQRLYRSGWNKYTLKAGDRITLTGAPTRSGVKEMRMLKVIMADGKTLSEGNE